MTNDSRPKRDWPEDGLRVLHVLMGLDVGGAERLLADALPRFPKDRYRMEVLALGSDGPMGATMRDSGIPVTVLDGSYSRPWFLLKFLRHLRSKTPHILDTHLYWPGVLGRVLGSVTGIELIVCHEHVHSGWLGAWRRRLDRHTWRWADAVIAVSEGVLRSRERDFPENLKRRVIWNGILIEEIDRHRGYKDAREIMGAGDKDIVAGWMGRVDDAQKALSVLLDAANLLHTEHPTLKWVLVGDGPDRQALERKTRQLGLGDTVKWLGKRPDGRNLLCGMDMFVLPSRYEGLPIAVLEAMAAQIPVVATGVAGLPEVVIDTETGMLIDPDDPEALARAVSNMAKNAGERKNMGKAGRKRVEEHFSVDNFVRNTDRFYRSLWAGSEVLRPESNVRHSGNS